MIDDITGHPLRSLELRVLTSKHRELHLQNGLSMFTLSKGTWASDSRWQLFTPCGDYFGDSIAEVFQKASTLYPGIDAWEGWTE